MGRVAFKAYCTFLCALLSDPADLLQSGRAPVITIFDHRGCQRGGPNKEYTGPASNDQDDEMCVKVQNPIIPYKPNLAVAQVSFSMRHARTHARTQGAR